MNDTHQSIEDILNAVIPIGIVLWILAVFCCAFTVLLCICVRVPDENNSFARIICGCIGWYCCKKRRGPGNHSIESGEPNPLNPNDSPDAIDDPSISMMDQADIQRIREDIREEIRKELMMSISQELRPAIESEVEERLILQYHESIREWKTKCITLEQELDMLKASSTVHPIIQKKSVGESARSHLEQRTNLQHQSVGEIARAHLEKPRAIPQLQATKKEERLLLQLQYN